MSFVPMPRVRNVAYFIIVSLGGAASATAQPIEEVVVTAQKREQNLQDVPLSVSAFSSEDLALSGVVDITRLDALAPGLNIGQSGSDVRPAIRGARTESVNERQDPVIGFFVDGVYQARTSQALAAFFDVERVEVLRGPQGTLFGRNTFGGAISVVSNKPVIGEFDYEVAAEYGRFDRTRADGFVNIPVNDVLALRVAGVIDRDDGYINNLQRPSESLGQRDQQALRVSLQFEPNDRFAATARVNYWDEGGIGGGDFGYQVLGTLRDATGTTSLNGTLDPNNPRNGAGGTPNDPGPYDVFRDTPATRETDAIGFNLDLSYDFGPVTLRSITAYQDFQAFRQNDSDFSPAPGSFSSVDTLTETFTQEFQILSNLPGPLEWVAGVYFLEDETEETFLFDTLCTAADTDGNPLTATVCTGPGSPGVAFGARGVVDTSAWAAFGQTTYAITDRLKATAGLRYTEDDKAFDRFDEDVFLNTGTVVRTVDEDATFDKVTWRAGLDYALTGDNLLYFTASTGFNSGGFNTSGPQLSFEEQTVTAYELGSKNLFRDGTLTMNAALFYNDYEDLLAQGFVNVGPTVAVFSTNAGEARAFGLELESEWRPADGLVFTGALAYTDSEVGDFVVGNPFVNGGQTINGVPNLLQLDGTDIALTPDVTATLTARKRFDLGTYGTLTGFVQFYYSGEYQTNDVDYSAGTQDSFTRTDLRVIWESPDTRFAVEGYVNNLEDEAVLNRTVVGGQDAIFANYARPTEYGIRVRVRR